MTYSVFKETYSNLIKKYNDIGCLFNVSDIYVIKISYVKNGSRWIKINEDNEYVDYIHYCNVFNATSFFKNLGGYERTECNYTKYGYLPTKQTSISPDKTRKTIWEYKFN